MATCFIPTPVAVECIDRTKCGYDPGVRYSRVLEPCSVGHLSRGRLVRIPDQLVRISDRLGTCIVSRYSENWHELDGVIVPPYVHGDARDISTWKGVEGRCPDGRVNAWEATIPNGVYMVRPFGGMHAVHPLILLLSIRG